MASLKEIERLTAEIEKKDEKLDGLWAQRRESTDPRKEAKLLEEIESVKADKKELFDQRNKLQDHLAGMARGTGSKGPYNSCCILAGSHLFFVLPP